MSGQFNDQAREREAAVRRIFDEGKRRHQAGQLAEAKQLYRQVLALDARQHEALHRLSAIAYQHGHKDAASELIAMAIRIDPGNASYHSNLGTVLKDLGRLPEAIAAYEAALRIKPDFAEVHYNYGNALKDAGQLQAAIAAYDQALRLKPDNPHGHYNRGNALKELTRFDEAIAAYDSALRIKADYHEAYSNRALAYKELGHTDLAIASLRRAICIKPDYAEAWCNLGFTRKAQGRFDEALDAYAAAIGIRQDYPEAWCNRGFTLEAQGRFDEALDAYAIAIRSHPDFAMAHFNEACARLLLGQFERGWQQFEWRLRPEFVRAQIGADAIANANTGKGIRSFTQPRWNGQDVSGKTVFLHVEQGLGDILQFCRYAPMLAARGARGILEAPPSLHRLLSRLDGVHQLVSTADAGGMQALPAFDYYCPLMSLPLAFGTNLDTIPAQTPYLSAEPETVAAWATKTGRANADRDVLRVGLVWAGAPRKHLPTAHALDRLRSMPFAQFHALLELPDIAFYSLQLGDEAVAQLNCHPCVIDCTADLHDFHDTAGLVANLDLVICVDTSVAHLAGAMGKPVWLLNRHHSCWRWLRDRHDSPWYPGMRIFRQAAPGDWDGVMRDVYEALQRYGNIKGG